jgi:hypothetical protein
LSAPASRQGIESPANGRPSTPRPYPYHQGLLRGCQPVAPFPPATNLPNPAATRSPWRAASKDLAAQPFAAGPRSERHVSGPERTGHSSHRPGAARRCSAPLSFGAQPTTASEPAERFPSAPHPSRAAVTVGASPQGEATPSAFGASGLTAVLAHNRARSLRRVAHLGFTDLLTPTGAPRRADLLAPALSAPSLATAPGITATAPSLAGSGGETPTTDLFAVPATVSSRAGLIEKQSTKAGRAVPAGVTTQGVI